MWKQKATRTMEAILALAREERLWSAQCNAQVCNTPQYPQASSPSWQATNITEGQRHTSSRSLSECVDDFLNSK